MADRIQLRRDTAANWTAYNPILLQGEPGIEIDTDQWKLGDGVHNWNDLQYRGMPCVQQKGQSTTTPMSQKAVTDELNQIDSKTAISVNDDSQANLNIGDEQGNVIAEFKGGHIKTKEFDSRNAFDKNNIEQEAGQSETKVLSQKFVTDKLNKIDSETASISGDDSQASLNIGDEQGNVIVEFKDGHVKTKEFDSRNIIDKNNIVQETGQYTTVVMSQKAVTDELDKISSETTKSLDDDSQANLNIGDLQGNVIVEFKDGHIKTKNFDSRDIAKKAHEYMGEKIDLSRRTFDLSLYMTVASSSEGHVIQAMAIKNNIAFIFYDSGYCRTYDFTTKQLISAFASGALINTNHCGGAVWSDKFFSDNALFPALYESGDLTNKCCYVMSVSSTSAILKQKLDFTNLSTYAKANGSQVVLDLDRKRLLYQQRVKSSITDLTNTFDICEFDIPSLTDGVADGNGVLVVDMTDDKVLKHYTLPFYTGIYQAAIGFNGQFIQTHGLGENSLGISSGIVSYDLNSESHQIRSYIDVTTLIGAEPEGIDIYDGKMYVSYVNGKIYEFTL